MTHKRTCNFINEIPPFKSGTESKDSYYAGLCQEHTYPVSIPFLLHLINYYGERITWVTLSSQWSEEDEKVLYRFEISENQLQFALLFPEFANR